MHSIGLDKGGIPGIAAFGMTFAISEVKTVPVAKTLAALVPVLFCADLGAAYTYRRAVNWSVLWRLLPSIVGGLVVGFCCLGHFSDAVIKTTAGCILLFLAAFHFAIPYFRQISVLPNRRNRFNMMKSIVPRRSLVFLQLVMYGICIGVFTVLANISGPIAVMYLIQRGLAKNELNATRAVLFVLVNCIKIPCQVYVGNLELSDGTVVIPLILISVLSTVVTARYLLPYVEQHVFERLSWSLVIIGAVKLMLRI